MSKTPSNDIRCRDTGMAIAFLFLLVGQFRDSGAWVAPAMVTLVVAMTFPLVLRPVAWAWFGLGQALGLVVSKVLLAAVYLVVVTPVGVVRRLLGYDPMCLRRWRKGRGSVLHTRGDPAARANLENPY